MLTIFLTTKHISTRLAQEIEATHVVRHQPWTEQALGKLRLTVGEPLYLTEAGSKHVSACMALCNSVSQLHPMYINPCGFLTEQS